MRDCRWIPLNLRCWLELSQAYRCWQRVTVGSLLKLLNVDLEHSFDKLSLIHIRDYEGTISSSLRESQVEAQCLVRISKSNIAEGILLKVSKLNLETESNEVLEVCSFNDDVIISIRFE